MDEGTEAIMREMYAAFNAREVDAALAHMTADVEWPNAWEGGRVQGKQAVAEYWRRQWAEVSSKVEPLAFVDEGGGTIAVTVAQTVDDARTGERLSESTVVHRFRVEDGPRIARMDVAEPG
jgi:ketosteroid isomerase-like protein